jgi:hypothetical protein
MRLIAAIILMLTMFTATAQPIKVEEISSYRMDVQVSDTTHIKSEITLKNLIDKPLVPGIGEIRLQKVHPEKLLFFSIPFTEIREPVEVKNVKAYSGKTNFNTKVEVREDYTVIYYEIWHPIEPSGEFTFTIEFDADLIEKGILFKTISIPVGADVDIKQLEINVNSDWKICYAEPEMENSWKASIPANHIAFFTAEFSLLPLPMLPVRGYLVFWGTILVVTLILAVLGLKRRK